MIETMRLSRTRAVVVLLLAVLHLGSGVVSAFGACCNLDVHQGGTPLMDCCIKGGPNHICPFMAKSKRSKAPGHMKSSCPLGHDDGVPVTGFISVPPDVATAVAPDMLTASLDAIEERAIVRVAYPPTPPPKF